MRHVKGIAVAWMLVLGLTFSAAGIAWEEIDASHSVTSHPRTGEPILTFTVWMEYDPVPRCVALRTEWTVSVIENGSEEVLVTDARPQRRSCVEISKFFSLSPAVEAIAGRHYRATFRIEDEQNELTHERILDYTAPDPLPIGSVAEPSGEAPEVDAGGIRSRIAEYYDILSTDYRQAATAVSLAEFFSDYAATEEDFPVMIFVASAADDGQAVDEGGPPAGERIDRAVFFFTIPSLNTPNVLVKQLETEEGEGEEAIIGRVFVRDGDFGLGAVTVFVHEEAWEVLRASQES